ncbi:MAG: MFS transporter [Parvicellaceae bacterium]
MLKSNRKIQKAWTFYDWANSVYPLVISSAIFPVFYAGYVDEKVLFFGFEFINTALITLLSASYFLLLVIILPILTGIADSTGNKKAFMQFFCYLGSFCCVLLSFFDKNHLEISMLLFVMAGIGFWSSLVFYNAFLPEIAEEKDHDRLSARGFSMGYIGSVILLLICLALIFTAPEEFKPLYTRICFALTGVWWFGFSHVTFKQLPKGKKINIKNITSIRKGTNELKKVWKYVVKTKRLKRFIYAFFVFSMAVQTIMLVAVYFGEKEVDWGDFNDELLDGTKIYSQKSVLRSGVSIFHLKPNGDEILLQSGKYETKSGVEIEVVENGTVSNVALRLENGNLLSCLKTQLSIGDKVHAKDSKGKKIMLEYGEYNTLNETMFSIDENGEIMSVDRKESSSSSNIGLLISILLIQLIAIPGAFLLSKLSDKKGNLFALRIVVFVWILLCFSAFLVYEPIHFYLIAGFVGLVMGGLQSLSRSTFSKFIPQDTKDTSSFFSFYDVAEKLGIVIGMTSYGFIEQVTGSMRNSIVALVVFFIVGLLLLFQVPKEEISIEKLWIKYST